MLIIDFEASGLMLGSYPIEVAWGSPDTAIESHLIKPCEEWLADETLWSAESESIHGISLQTLLSSGEEPADVAKRMVAAINEVDVIYSDNPYYEQMWMDRLFDSTGHSHWHQFSDLNILLHSITDSATVQGAFVEARKTAPPSHRAADDVAHLLQVYRLCEEYKNS